MKEQPRKSNSVQPSELIDLDINVIPVKCPLCNERLLRLTREHAISHGYQSLSEYRKSNGINYLTLAQRSKENFKRLYNIDFKRWVVGYRRHSHSGLEYGTKIYDPFAEGSARSASKFPLNDGTFNDHFKGSNPLAIFAYGTHARYFCFDVDSKERAEADAFRLINQLRRQGIEDKHIHISFSGSKGYHIELFIDKHLRHEDWNMFGEYITYKAGISEGIEYRPNRTNGHALKLPLTFHPKTKRFAGYCDVDTLEMYDIIDSHDYLHEIEQMDTSVILETIRIAEKTDAERRAEEERKKEEQRRQEAEKKKAVKVSNVEVFQTVEEKARTAKRILLHGLTFENGRKQEGEGKRWLAMRDMLIPFLKIEQGLDEEGTAEVLREWTVREIEKGNILTPYDRCMKDIDDLITDYYPIVENFQSVTRELEVTRAELEWVMSVIDNGGTRNARDLLWVLLLYSKAYKGKVKRDGSFFVSNAQIQKLLSKPKKISATTLTKQRRWLQENGYIKFEIPPLSYVKKLAPVYELANIGESSPEIIDSIALTDDIDGRQLLRDIAAKLYTPSALKKFKIK